MVGAENRNSAWKALFSNAPWAVVWIGLLVFLFYHRTLDNTTALDDTMVLTSNTYVQDGISGIPDIFSHDSFYGATHRPASRLGWRYRPLSVALFAFTYEAFGKDWRVYHLLSILLYACCAWAVYFFLRRWFFSKAPEWALLTALFFVILPIHVEVVANIKSADELLAFLFSVLYLDSLLRWSNQQKNSIKVRSGLFLLLALLSKESSILLLPLTPLLFWVTTRDTLVRTLRSSWPMAIIAAAYVALRISISQFPDTKVDLTTDPYFLATGMEKVATVSFVLLKYFQQILFPGDLIFDYGYRHIPYVTFSDPWVLLSVVLHIGLLCWAAIRCVKREPDGFLLAAYLGGILLMSNLIMPVGPIMADRFAYFPGLFLIVFLVVTIQRAASVRWTLPSSLGLLLLFVVVTPFAYVKSASRVSEWKDNRTLYQADRLKAPESFRVLAFHGMEEIALAENITDSLARRERLIYGIRQLEEAYRIYPEYKNMYKEWGLRITVWEIWTVRNGLGAG